MDYLEFRQGVTWIVKPYVTVFGRPDNIVVSAYELKYQGCTSIGE